MLGILKGISKVSSIGPQNPINQTLGHPRQLFTSSWTVYALRIKESWGGPHYPGDVGRRQGKFKKQSLLMGIEIMTSSSIASSCTFNFIITYNIPNLVYPRELNQNITGFG